ncbi:MAG TPA: ABC transporter permease [Ktedonobacterales bacterium]|jgi:peptide/nickel transport system permease protein/oligopeptide transport system permease protein
MDNLVAGVVPILIGLAVLALLVFAGLRLGIRFVIRRLVGLVFVIIGVTFITFIMGYFAPGNAVYSQLGQHYSKETYDQLTHFYGLDLPWYQQYLNFLGRLLHLDLGYSYINDADTVWSILARYVPASAVLGIGGVVLAVVIGVPLGVIAAVRARTRVDSTVQGVALVLFALPAFVIIPLFDLVMVWLHTQGLPSLAVSGWGTIDTMIAPIVIFSLSIFAFYVRLTRSSMLEVLGQDYVRTARAKGIIERVVIWRHAFRNALIPLLTAVGPALAFAVVGVFVVELLFNIPGIGAETIAAITQRDFPVVQGTVILLAVAIVLMNLVTDIAYGFADPRIKTE